MKHFQDNRFFYTLLTMFFTGQLPDTDLGPVISPDSKKRICRLIQSGIDQGAKCVLDGRDLVVRGFEKGNFIGPTILTGVKVRHDPFEFNAKTLSRPIVVGYAAQHGVLQGGDLWPSTGRPHG